MQDLRSQLLELVNVLTCWMIENVLTLCAVATRTGGSVAAVLLLLGLTTVSGL